LLFRVYGWIGSGTIRSIIRRIVMRLEGGGYFSVTIRRIFSSYHGVEIGLYTRGPCMSVKSFLPGTRIGRYCSIFPTVHAFSGNHPMNVKSTHAFFFNPQLGYAESDIITRVELTIGNDVWMGHNAIILPSVSAIGDGAVIGAGAVVHQDVPPYAVVVGNPARIVRFRFSEETIQALLASRWWERSVAELRPEFETFRVPLEGERKVR
jgi:virginiamycin A acetyltransferase